MGRAEVSLLLIAKKTIQGIALDTKHALVPTSMMSTIMILVTVTVLATIYQTRPSIETLAIMIFRALDQNK